MPADAPFALTAHGEGGIVITAVNACAEAEGVRVGQRLADVRAALPGLASAPAEPDEDARALVLLARWAGRYAPARNVEGADGLWLETTGVAHLFGGEAAMLEDVHRRLARPRGGPAACGFTVRSGLADTPEAAFALARFATSAARPFAIAPPGRQAEALAGLPVAGLGLEAETVLLLGRLGLKRIGQLYGLPRAALERRFRGVAGRGRLAEMASFSVLRALDAALGLLALPRRPLVEPPAFVVRQAFAEPLVTATPLTNVVNRLAHELCRLLADTAQGARRLGLALYRTDATVIEITVGTSLPCREPAHLLHLVERRLEDVDAGFGIDLVVLAALAVEAMSVEQGRLDGGEGGAAVADPAPLVDRLANRLGAEAVLRLTAGASHVPERAGGREPVWRARRAELATRPPPRPPRPPLLLEPPEPIGVLAEVPEGPPVRFTWRRKTRTIVRFEGPERIAGEWWRDLVGGGLDGGDAGRRRARTRDYYRIEDRDGGRYWVFRDGLYGEGEEERPPVWYLHGLFG